MSAAKVNKERFEVSANGRVRWTVDWAMDNRAEAISGIPRVFETLPFAGASGGPWINEEGKYIATARYEGVVDEPTEADDDYDISGELREVKIEEFPNRELLKTEFGAYEEDGRLKFPATIPKEGASREFGPLPPSQEVENPFFNGIPGREVAIDPEK